MFDLLLIKEIITLPPFYKIITMKVNSKFVYNEPVAEVIAVGSEGCFLGASNTSEDFNLVPLDWKGPKFDGFGF